MAATTLAAVGSFFTANAGTIAAVSGLASAGASAAAGSRQRSAMRTQQRQQALQASRARRQAIRQSQVARARAQAAAAAAGAIGSSGAQGGIGSLSSQLGSGLGYASQQQGLTNIAGAYQQQAANWGTFGQVAGAAFDMAGGFKAFQQQTPNEPQVPNYYG